MQNFFLLFMNIGLTELLVILVIILLLFGSTKLPKLAKSIGLSLKEFKKAAKEAKEDPDKEETLDDIKAKSENSEPRKLD